METKQSNNSASLADAVKIAGINQRALFNLEWENDTVFKKRELNYKTKAAFQKDLEAGKISKYTTVFIKDTKEIYKNGQYYGSKLDNFNIANENLSNLFVYLTKRVTEDELSTIDELIKDLPYKKIGEDNIFNGKVCISSEENSTIDASVLIKYTDRDNFRIEWNSSAYNVAIYSIFGWLQYVLQVSGGKISINKFNFIGFTPSVSSKNISIVSYDMFNTEEGISVTLTKSGNGNKFLSDNGEYKEITPLNSGMPHFDLSSFSEESGDVSDEILNSIKSIGLSDSESTSISFYNKAITYIGELRFSAGNYSISGISVSEEATDYSINSVNISISPDLKVYSLSRFNQEIKKSGLGDKFLSDDGTYKELKSSNDIILEDIDLSSIAENINPDIERDLTTTTYNDVLNALKSNSNVFMKFQVGGGNMMFNMIDWFVSEIDNIILIDFDISIISSLGAGSIASNKVEIQINANNKYKVIVTGFTVTNQGKDIFLASSTDDNYTGTGPGALIILEASGDGTKFLANDGKYKEINSYYKLTDKFYELTSESTSTDIKAAIGGDEGFESFKSAIKSHIRIFCEFNNASIEYCGELQCSYTNMQGTEIIAISMLGYTPFAVEGSAASCATLKKINNEYSFLTGIMGQVQ